MQYWIVLFSVALDFTCAHKCVFLSYSKYTTTLICLWNDGQMFWVVKVYFTIDTKFAVLSNEFQQYQRWKICLHMVSIHFLFCINSFNNNPSSNCYVNNIVIEQKRKHKEREKRKRNKKKLTLWHCEDYNISIVHYIQLSFTLLYSGLCVQLFFFFSNFVSFLFKFSATVNICSRE